MAPRLFVFAHTYTEAQIFCNHFGINHWLLLAEPEQLQGLDSILVITLSGARQHSNYIDLRMMIDNHKGRGFAIELQIVP